MRAKKGKWLRAEPVAALFEQGRVKLAGSFPALEDEMCDFGLDGLSSGRSPDRFGRDGVGGDGAVVRGAGRAAGEGVVTERRAMGSVHFAGHGFRFASVNFNEMAHRCFMQSFRPDRIGPVRTFRGPLRLKRRGVFPELVGVFGCASRRSCRSGWLGAGARP